MKRLTLTIAALLFSMVSFATIGPIAGITFVCVGDFGSLTDTSSGGTWSSNNIGVVSIDSITGVITGVSVGSATITYMIGASYATTTVTVKPTPAPITGIRSYVCLGEGFELDNLTSGGGYWELSDSLKLNLFHIMSNSAMIIGESAGIDTVRFIDTAGCASRFVITIEPAQPPITGNTFVRIDSTITLSNPLAGGIWSSGFDTVATVGSTTGIVTGISAGVTTICYHKLCDVFFTIRVLPPVSTPVLFSTNKSEIDIYPNPTTTSLTVASKDKITTITINDCLGQTFLNDQYSSQQAKVDVSALPAGVYLIRINSAEVRRFVKQ